MLHGAGVNKPSCLPTLGSAEVRKRWLELFELSYATRRITQQPIEPGVHAVVIPPVYQEGKRTEHLEADVCAAMRQVPQMANAVRLALERIAEFEVPGEAAARQWLGPYGCDLAKGRARATAFIDLAYLEAALLDNLWTHEVIVDFRSPLTFFRRGALADYANVLEAVTTMVFAGSSLADTARHLARGVLARLQLYAHTFLHLSRLYTDCHWRIDRETFMMEVPGTTFSLGLSYWELRGGPERAAQALEAWRTRIETLLGEAAPYLGRDFPHSHAA
jgi:hypothetical protein